MDTILRPSTLNVVHTTIIEGLRIYTTPLASSCETKTWYQGLVLEKLMTHLMPLQWGSFGMNALDAATLLPS